MAVKIRLMRIGAKKRPFYRIVAVDERNKRTGGYLELLGTYNPLTEPKEIILKQDRIDEWVKNGAVASDGYLRILGKAPQKPIRPSKKAKPEAKASEPSAPKEEAVKTEEPATENPTEESTDQKVTESETTTETQPESAEQEIATEQSEATETAEAA